MLNLSDCDDLDEVVGDSLLLEMLEELKRAKASLKAAQEAINLALTTNAKLEHRPQTKGVSHEFCGCGWCVV
jgi:hypothetical protein